MQRRLLHIDMDAFFASVEIARNPSLRGQPVIVGGGAGDSRGVVTSASYEARHFGVRSAMPIAQARRLCPQAVFIPCSHGLYGKVSRRIHAILESVTPQVQMASIDEANLDITGSIHLFGSEEALAAHIKKMIWEQEQITATIGIASNKAVAKIAANEAKPNCCLTIDPGDEQAFLAPLSVRVLPGVGKHTGDSLEQLGIMTVQQLREIPPGLLERCMGENLARHLRVSAMGEGDDRIVLNVQPKSISRETTFSSDLTDWEVIQSVLFRLVEDCAYTMRSEGLETRRVTLKVRYRDFLTKTFSKSLSESTSLDTTLLDAIAALVPKAKSRRASVRLIGVNLSALSAHQHQLDLFHHEQQKKWERVMQSVDAVRDKLGFDAMGLGRGLNLTEKKIATEKKPDED
ncbi:MAG: DNA polymerase IV [Candidatus Hydrogenedentes bacterium]|nr:DNA polymerase IV [Candidatus Hydrogenedentota bacterium]